MLVAVLDARDELLEHDPRLLRQKGVVKGASSQANGCFVKGSGEAKGRKNSAALEAARAPEAAAARPGGPASPPGSRAAKSRRARPEEAAGAKLATEDRRVSSMRMRRAPWAPIAFRSRR